MLRNCEARTVVILSRRSATVLKVSRNQLRTTPVKSGGGKHPIQQWGWEWLVRQERSKRPMSPHLTIYKPMMTWMTSGAHRITGCAMGCAVIIGSIGFAVLPIDFTQVVEFIRGIGLPAPVTAAFRFIIAFPLVFHTLNGIRFILFDMAKGTDIKSVYMSAKLVIGLAAVIATCIVVYPMCCPTEEQKALKAK